MYSWLSTLDVRLQVAIIGVASALVTIVLKDVALYFWKEARADQRSAMEVYRNYSDPLLSASESLFWRLRETLTDSGRGSYLKESGKDGDFDKYKYESTLFRLAVLIGWIRAYRRELTFLSLSGGKQLESLRLALSRFEAALADGAHVEIERVKSVSELWNIPIPKDERELSRVSVRVEQTIKSTGSTRIGNQDLSKSLDETSQTTLCQLIADCLCEEANVNRIPPEIILETKARALQSLSVRETWLYRDFQSGLGDLMVREVTGANRRFDVCGFKDFEALLYSDDADTVRWISRLNMVFDRLDISGADRFDARVQMLESTLLATIDLLFALTTIDKSRSLVADETLVEANRLKADLSWRKGNGRNTH